MTSGRPWRIWLAFAVCLAVVLGAMGFVSHTAVRLDRARRASQRRAQREELIRLALWRMDAAMTTVLAQESARPYHHYQPVFTIGEARATGRAETGPRGVMIPSPLLRPTSPLIRLYFAVDGEGAITSPQVPTGGERAMVTPAYLTDQAVGEAAERLVELQTTLVIDGLRASLPEVPAAPAGPGTEDLLVADNISGVHRTQMLLNSNEFNARNAVQRQIAQRNPQAIALGSGNDIRDGQARCVWAAGELILARRVIAGGAESVVGCWFDWPRTRQWLLDSVADLLPSANLVPLSDGANENGGTAQLATLPVLLASGEVPAAPISGAGAVTASLAAAWAGTLLAACAAAVLIHGTLSLSERRGAFVWAVTHELRTPLTTLRMYTEMLRDGLVPHEKRDEYIATLDAETHRLCRLVENLLVLTYSRFEGRRPAAQRRDVDLVSWLADLEPRLAQWTRGAAMKPVIEIDVSSAHVHTDAAALEQIVANLVENACKYAAGADDRRIHVQLSPADTGYVLRVRDHGPGVPRQAVRSIFRPFRRAGRDAAGPRGGLGLGLAISRRLARALGGELTLERGGNDGGASFAVTIPQPPCA